MAYVARVTDVVRHFKASFLEGKKKKTKLFPSMF